MKLRMKNGFIGNTISAGSIVVALAAASLAVPTNVNAEQRPSVSCSVAIDYVYNGTVVEPYSKDFVVEQGVGFVDDFSTTLREKRFTASIAKEAGDVVVSIDYFNDVGVFHAIRFNTSLTMQGGGIQSTSGSYAFYASSGVSPGSVGGNHVTNYTLTCRRD